MKISELIKELEEIHKVYGDLPVRYDNEGYKQVECAVPYNENGCNPDPDEKDAVEAFLH